MASRSTRRTSNEPGSGLLRAYPRWWRDRYGDDVAAILEARPPDLNARVDLLRGAFDAHLRGADPGPRPWRAIAVALVAGAAWTISGVASVGGPAPPDWPGYLAMTLPVAVLGAIAAMAAILGVLRFAWPSNGPSLEFAVAATIVGHLAWAGALTIALLGGPYGAVTGLAQTLAALATVGTGLMLLRSGASPVGEAVALAGAALLLPTPAGWLVTGALWTAVGLWQYAHARSGDTPRASAG
ncbi:MAG: hypothetical protein ABJC39_07430 [Chloroflexota bacterium]